MPNLDHDLTRSTDNVVIVGGGLAGLFCALKLAPRPVTVISAAPLGQDASTAWAQGGIAAAVAEGDSAEAHAADTVAAGAGLVDEAIALGIAREAGARIHDLLQYGVPFDRDLEGRLAVGREAAHSARRIVPCRRIARQAIISALTEAVHAPPSIRVIEGYTAEALLAEDGVVTGLSGAQGRQRPRQADGPSHRRPRWCDDRRHRHLYAVTTNPAEASGLGSAIAARPAPSSPIRNSCSFIRPRSWSAAIRRRSQPKLCAAKARRSSTTRANASCRRGIDWLNWRRAISWRAAYSPKSPPAVARSSTRGQRSAQFRRKISDCPCQLHGRLASIRPNSRSRSPPPHYQWAALRSMRAAAPR